METSSSTVARRATERVALRSIGHMSRDRHLSHGCQSSGSVKVSKICRQGSVVPQTRARGYAASGPRLRWSDPRGLSVDLANTSSAWSSYRSSFSLKK